MWQKPKFAYRACRKETAHILIKTQTLHYISPSFKNTPKCLTLFYTIGKP